MTKLEVRCPPPDWASYGLTIYLDGARANQFGTFHNKRIVVQDICRVDSLLAAALDGWRDPPALVPAMLFLRSHAAFRAGAGAAMAGQCAEAPCLFRLCLECAGYAAVVGRDEALAEAFLRRSDSEQARRKVQAAFNSKSIKEAAKALDTKLETVFSLLYESLIDFGAHPNEMMLTSNLEIEPRQSGTLISSIYLQGDGSPLDFALKRSVQVGLWSARVFAALFPERVRDTGAHDVIAQIAPLY